MLILVKNLKALNISEKIGDRCRTLFMNYDYNFLKNSKNN